MILPDFIRGEGQSFTFALKDDNDQFYTHGEVVVTAKLGVIGATSTILAVQESENDFVGIADNVPCWLLVLDPSQSQALVPGMYTLQITAVVASETTRFQYNVRVLPAL